MPTLEADVDPSQFVSNHYGDLSPETLRQSETRRARLARWAQVISHEGTELTLNPSHGETAQVRFDGKDPEIEIPAWEIPQPVTDLDREAYDFLMQRTMTLHEVGHIRYTDQDTLSTVIESVAPERREQFHSIWNALEDGAIENQLRGDFSVSDEIEVMNANYMRSHGGGKSYEMLDAIQRACLDLAVYDTGDLRTLLDENESRLDFEDDEIRDEFCDEVLPVIEQAVPDIVTEPDPVERTRQIKDLWDNLEQYIEPDAEPENRDLGGKGDHSSQDNGSGTHADQLDEISAEDVDERVERVLDEHASTDRDGETRSGEGQEQNRDENGDSETAELDGTDASETTPNSDTGRQRETTQTSEDEGERTDENGSAGAGGSREDCPQRDSKNPDGGDEQPDDQQLPGASSAASQPHSEAGDERREANDREPDDSRTQSDSDHPGQQSRSGERGKGEETDRPGADELSNEHRDVESNGEEQEQPESEEVEVSEQASSGSGSPLSTDDIGVDPDPDPSLEQNYLDRISEEVSQQEENLETLEEEVSAFTDVLEQLEETNRQPTELAIPTGNQIRQSAWESTRRHGVQLQQVLEDQLQQEQRSSWRRGRPRGQVDTRSLPRIARSDPRVFRQRNSPDEKDYSAAIVLDRSGSMSSDIHYAEEAAVALTFALEELDIDTCVIDMCGSRPRLAKPYGCPVEPNLDSLLTGETGGGTPLSEALRLARERVAEREEHPFCIVVTDGKPDNQTAYKDELRDTRFPVLGVYLAFNSNGPNSVSSSVKESAHLFDQRQIVTDPNRLLSGLRGLCREVMF